VPEKTTNIAVLIERIEGNIEKIRGDIADINRKLEMNYPTKAEVELVKQELQSKIDSYEIVRKLVYGMVITILTGVLGVILNLVLKK
jgi:valyl-tRNA synthetase